VSVQSCFDEVRAIAGQKWALHDSSPLCGTHSRIAAPKAPTDHCVYCSVMPVPHQQMPGPMFGCP
jgi:hypothetical protein